MSSLLCTTPFSSLLSRIVLNAEAKLPVTYVLCPRLENTVYLIVFYSLRRKGFRFWCMLAIFEGYFLCALRLYLYLSRRLVVGGVDG